MTRHRRRLLVPVGLAAAILAGAGAAWAYWTTTGSGIATAGTATLGAPTSVTATATGGTGVAVAWAGSSLSSGQPAAGYYVTRMSGSASAAACGTSAAQPTTGTSCSDTGVPDGSYRYVVTAVYGSWTADSAPSATVTVVSDTTPPSVPAPAAAAAVTSGSNPVFVDHEVVTLTDGATDAGSGVRSVSYYYCAGATGTCTSVNGTLIGTSTTAATGFSVASAAPLAPADGPYRIVAVATDNAGNTSGYSAPTLVTVDTAPPTVSRPIVNGHP
jgi:Bacterial Ig-like domain